MLNNLNTTSVDIKLYILIYYITLTCYLNTTSVDIKLPQSRKYGTKFVNLNTTSVDIKPLHLSHL